MEGRRGIGAAARFTPLGLACCVVGLTVDSLWCILMGYTPAFVSVSGDGGPLANLRLFYLAGALAVAVACMAVPGRLRHGDSVLRFVLPVLGSVGTVCFSLTARGALPPSDPLVLCGLFVTGGVQFWIMARFILLVARTRGVRAVTGCVTGWLMLRLPLVELVDGYASRDVQIALAVAAPLLAAALFEAACALMRRAAPADAMSRTIFGVPQLTSLRGPSRHNERVSMCLMLFIAAAVLAVVASVSDMGLWGISGVTISDSSPWLLGVLAPAMLVGAFAWCALVLPSSLPLAIRFQPALFLTLAGLFAAAVQQNPGGDGLAVFTFVVQLCQLFARLLFWTVVATALDVLDMPSYRTIGLGEAVYAALSIVWVAVLADAPMITTLAVMFVLYVLVIALLCAVWALSGRWERGATFFGEEDAMATSRPAAPGESPSMSARQPMLDRCTELAAAHGLSPRETEVFVLLAQGRSHAFIQEELGLAASTVKTHVAHIYGKFGVNGRQELLDVLWR